MSRRPRRRTDALTLGGAIVLTLLVVMSIVPLVVPGLDARSTVGPRLSEPSGSWWFGTDQSRSVDPASSAGRGSHDDADLDRSSARRDSRWRP